MIYIIFLAVLQGFTEFLPISSSGHLELCKNIPFLVEMHSSSWQNIPENFFNLLLHFGTLMAVLVFYRQDIINIVKGFFTYTAKLLSTDKAGDKIETRQDTQKNKIYFFYALYIVAATFMLFPVALFKDNLDHLLRSEKEAPVLASVLAFIFIVNGIVLMSTWIMNKVYIQKAKDQNKELNIISVIIIGLAQMIAVLPGISRSGMTITASLYLGINKKESARFSLLLSIPAILGGLVLEAKDINFSSLNFPIAETIVGIIFSFVVGLISIKILVKMVEKMLLYQFGIYTFLLGIIIYVLN